MFWKILGTTKSKKEPFLLSFFFFWGGGRRGRGMGGTYHSSHHGFVFWVRLVPSPLHLPAPQLKVHHHLPSLQPSMTSQHLSLGLRK